MELPSHVQALLGITSDISEEDLGANEVAGRFAQTVFGLSSVEFASAAVAALSGRLTYVITSAERVTRSWNYLEIFCDGSLECAGACTPESGSSLPATAAAQLLVGGWFSDPRVLDGNHLVAQQVVYGVKSAISVPTFPLRILKQWGEVCPLLDGCAVPPTWIVKNQMQITSNSRIPMGHVSGFRFQDLFIESVSEVKSKWRYLAIYRIFEHGYLSEIFETLKSGFFGSPKESLTAASR